MTTRPSAAIAQDPSLLTIKALAKAYQAFSTYSETFVRRYDLTPAQFDVIATLGNTQGLTMGEIGAKTRFTKGTLTGIVTRLEKKQLVARQTPPGNRRAVRVSLARRGETVFNKRFLPMALTFISISIR